jgi:hypothetical protein
MALVALLAMVQSGAFRAHLWQSAGTAAAPTHPSVDVDAVIQQARHTIAPVHGEAGTFEVRSGDYHLTLDSAGFTYHPAATAGSLAIGTEAVTRGGHDNALDAGRWTAQADVAARPLAPAVSEQVTARSGEVEWDVVLASEPAGHGALAVRAAVDGVAGTPQALADGHTLRLTLTDGHAVDVGETVVVDATGHVLYRGMPAIEGGHVELTVPGRVLDHAHYPLTIDPTVSSGQQVTSNLAQQPALAFDGEDFLVVWNEYDGSNFEIRAAQVNSDGTLVQPIGFLSSTGDGKDDERPSVAFNGKRFLVAWEHTFSDTDIDVQGRLVSHAGFPVGGVRSIITPSGNQTYPSVAAAGSTFYVVWSDARTGAGDIMGTRVDNAGTLLDVSGGVTVANTATAETQPDIAASSGALLVSYQTLPQAGDPDVYAQRVDLSLVPIGTAIPLAISTAPEQDAKVASNGSEYLVVWGGPGDIQGRRVATDGSRPGATVIPIAAADDNQSLPDVAFNGGSYLVAWKDNRNFWNEIWAARVSGAGTVQDASGFRVFDQATNEGTGGIFNPPAVAPGPGAKWAIDHEVVFGGVYHYSVAPK